MNTLEYCHELEFNKISFIERKIRITHPKTIIIGPPKVGKSYLIYDYLSKFENKEFLYIDFFDIRNSVKTIKEKLEEYVYKNKIKVLVLENFDFSIKIPFCESVIISTNKNKKLKGYKNLFLSALDFEEYLLHENKNQNITQSFNTFLKHGNFPESVNNLEFEVYTKLQNFIKLYTKDLTSQKILISLIENIDEKKSLNQLYLNLKNENKISKDKFYEKCKDFEEEKVIYFIKKFNQIRATKKIYVYNWSFFNAINYKKKFKNQLTNIIFQELINKYDEIYYLDFIDFFVPKEKIAISCIPFFNSALMQNSLKKMIKNLKENEIKSLFIITVSNNEIFYKENITITVLPFYEWALS